MENKDNRIKEQFIGNPALHKKDRDKRAIGSETVLLACRERGLLSRTIVFLPCAGNRNGTSLNNVGSNGNCWSSTYNNANNAYNVNFNSGNFNTNNNNRNNGRSVRLVRVAENFPWLCLFVQNNKPFPFIAD